MGAGSGFHPLQFSYIASRDRNAVTQVNRGRDGVRYRESRLIGAATEREGFT